MNDEEVHPTYRASTPWLVQTEHGDDAVTTLRMLGSSRGAPGDDDDEHQRAHSGILGWLFLLSAR